MTTRTTTGLHIKAITGLGLLGLTLAGCSSDEESAPSADAEAESRFDISVDADVATVTEGTLQVCSDLPYPPFEYFDAEGNAVGFDIDIAQALADAFDLEMEIVQSSFDGIQSGVALNSDQCDLAISGMSITEERAGNMLFSDPYLDDNLGLLVPSESGFASLGDLGEAPVGVQQATTGADYAVEEGLNVVEFEDAGLMIQGLETGQVDAVIGNISIVGYQTGESDEYTFAEEFDTGEQLGIAAQSDNQQLIDAVNEVLAELESTGGFEELESRWFDSTDTPDEGGAPEEGASANTN